MNIPREILTTTKPKLCPRAKAEAEFAKLLAAVEARGFYGTASITVSVQDGAIQHLRIAVDKLVK